MIKAGVLLDLTIIDELRINSEKKHRFRVVYTLLSIKSNLRLNIHTYPDNKTLEVNTIQSLFCNASWLEREA